MVTFESILESFDTIGFSCQRVFPQGLVRRPDEPLAGHRATIETICSGDGTAVEKIMRRHFRRTIRHLTTESPPPF